MPKPQKNGESVAHLCQIKGPQDLSDLLLDVESAGKFLTGSFSCCLSDENANRCLRIACVMRQPYSRFCFSRISRVSLSESVVSRYNSALQEASCLSSLPPRAVSLGFVAR